MENILPRIKMLSERIEKIANNNLAQYGITLSQVRVLVILYHSEDGVYSLKELENFFNVSQQTIAGVVSRLEKKGLLEGFSDRQDRRVKKVRITENGSQLSHKAECKIAAIERELTECLTEEETDIFKDLLSKICDHLK